MLCPKEIMRRRRLNQRRRLILEEGAAAGPDPIDMTALSLTSTLTGAADFADIRTYLGGSFPALEGIAFNSDGTKLLVSNLFGDRWASFTCNTAYDITDVTGTGSIKTLNNPQNMIWLDDGTIYQTMYFPNSMRTYTSATAYETNSGDTQGNGVAVSSWNASAASDQTAMTIGHNDGTKAYAIYKVSTTWYLADADLSTPYDISTISNVQELSLTGLGLTRAVGTSRMQLSDDGKRLWIMGSANEINTLDLATAWDITTATHSGTNDLTVAAGVTDFWVDENAAKVWATTRNTTAALNLCRIYS